MTDIFRTFAAILDIIDEKKNVKNNTCYKASAHR